MPKRIVVVDNDLMSRDLSRRVLNAGGYEVICVGDAEEALRVVPTLLPDLVLMDLKLPGIDGIEATKRLRASRKTATVPIAMLSAQAFGDHIERARQAGCIDYLTKPVGARQLLDRVRVLVGDEELAADRSGRAKRGRR